VYRLLALDLDGTLLRHDQQVDPRDADAIAELQRAGIAVTIVTGRLHSGSVGAARSCNIEGAIGCVEGSHLVDVDGTTRAHHPLSESAAGFVREVVGEHQLASFIFDRDEVRHEPHSAQFAQYVSTWSPKLTLVDAGAAWQTPALAVVAVGETADIVNSSTVLASRPGEVFCFTFGLTQFPGKHGIIIRAAGPSKGTALTELCRLAGCGTHEAVAIGDWLNDVPMFDVAGRSFAMHGAPELVSERATDRLRARAGSGGGIAEAIARAWG
jgi:Cof subfamily protein (haloacid dehalogenase superfamily)